MTARSGNDGADAVLRFARLGPARRGTVLRSLTVEQRRELAARWAAPWAHAGQLPPAGDWRVWLIRAGRGFGKTRAGAEWVSQFARDHKDARIALVGGTADEVRAVMVDGVSGLAAVARDGERVEWKPTAGEVRFESGARAFVYSAEAPEKLRGPEHHAAWCDELAKWRWGDAAWDNLMMGMRLGDKPQVVVTTTPRPTAFMRRVMASPGTIQTHGRTADNPHLPKAFMDDMRRRYVGTRLGRQELDGEVLGDVEGALWTRALIETCRVDEAPALRRVVVAVDPPAGIGGDACGIVVVGLGADGLGYVIEDASVHGASPEGWARIVADRAAAHDADRVLAESNQGGEMIRSVLLARDAGLPLELVRAVAAKAKRAEPVAAFYAQGRVRHVGAFPLLEDELCGMLAAGGYDGPGRSPDRADALVWAVGELMLGARGTASVRAL